MRKHKSSLKSSSRSQKTNINNYPTILSEQIQRAIENPNPSNLTPQVIQRLQSTHGNNFVLGLINQQENIESTNTNSHQNASIQREGNEGEEENDSSLVDTPIKPEEIEQLFDMKKEDLLGFDYVDYEVKKKDVLWNIAKEVYNKPTAWNLIYNHNRDLIKNPHWIYPGQILKIPIPVRKVSMEELQIVGQLPADDKQDQPADDKQDQPADDKQRIKENLSKAGILGLAPPGANSVTRVKQLADWVGEGDSPVGKTGRAMASVVAVPAFLAVGVVEDTGETIGETAGWIYKSIFE